MAGKRLLDAARLFTAGRSIAKQHIGLRQQQWDVFSKTSGLAKAVKSQTDRVTVTAGAAVELAKRFSENTPAYQQQHDPVASKQATSTSEAVSQSVNEIEEEIVRSSNQPDPNADDGSLWSLRRRELQRQAEAQIPAQAASTQYVQDGSLGRDTFGARPEGASAELSSLPRVKVPKHAEDPRDAHQSTTNHSLNQDVFYSPGQTDGSTEPPNDSNIDGLFTAPKVAKMLGDSSKDVKNPYGTRQKQTARPLPEMVEAEKRWSQEREGNLASAQPETEPTKQSSLNDGDTDTQDLARSIAQDTASPPISEQPLTQSYEMHESRVPSSRFGRLWQYGGLATSMAFGAVGESFRRMAGGSSEGSLMLSEGNINRLVAKLSRMRGAALKLGQMMSFQDSKILPPTINTILQRVQDNADYMPASQRNKVLIDNLGSNWRDLFLSFEEKPFAAASIGQVHKATLASNGKAVAVKVQYPGVRNSIDSDLNNLALLLTASKLLPKGLYLDKTIANARVELGWECDYEREAKACQKFAELLKDEEDTFKVPTIYTEASGPGVLTAEFMTGTAVTKMKDLNQGDRDWVGTQILRLCLRELMEWRFMQTDPNWTNFLYNRDSQKLELLDFGASRDFPDKFVEPYVSLIIAATKGDREKCKEYSIELGYLTGHESKDMLRAHVDSILTLAEPFVESAPEVYDFEDQTITDRVRANIGLMLRERLAPPPEETYSLHRKLSGAFLLCARLRSRVRARDMFANAVQVWNKREVKGEHHSSI